MNRRNWLDLARKLVDQYDMDYTLAALQAALGQQALGFFGEGVLVTTQFPNPFPITMSGSVLGGTVGNGVAYDPNGQITQIIPSSPTSKAFTIQPSDPSNPRWDLLVLVYVQTGQTPVPKPSDPITTISLNLIDDFALMVREGTPSPTPAYPAKQALDIILAGLQVPAGATIGTQVNVDLNVRENAQPFVATMPVFIEEHPTGAINGINTTFGLSQLPITSQSVLVYLDGVYQLPTSYSIAGQVLTMFTAPALAQSLEVWYIEDSPMSQNPLAGVNNVLGTGNGATTTFTLPGTPPNKDAVQVFVDGLKVDPSEWSLLIGSPNSQVIFNTAPAAATDIGAFYLVNSANVGSGPSGVQTVTNEGVGVGHVAIGISGTELQLRNIKAGANVTVTQNGTDITIASTGGGGGGGGSYVAQGEETAPVTVDPLIGITPTADALQSWYLQGQSGQGRQNVTAAARIAAGSSIGQRISLMIANNTDFPSFADGNGLSLNGTWPALAGPALYSKIELEWTGLRWSEVSRR